MWRRKEAVKLKILVPLEVPDNISSLILSIEANVKEENKVKISEYEYEPEDIGMFRRYAMFFDRQVIDKGLL